jgi:hypothetical protein
MANELVPVVGFEGMYSVSRDGNVYSHKNRLHQGKWLIPSLKKGFKFVCLCQGSKVVQKTMHRLVAEAFIESKLQVLDRPAVEIKKFVPGEMLEFTAETEILQIGRASCRERV